MIIKDMIRDIKSTIRYKRALKEYARFKVEKAGGSLYLTHRGVAFMELDGSQTSEDISALLDDARITSMKFVTSKHNERV
jgi:hypothetical protein